MDWHQHFVYDESSPSCLRWKADRRRGFGEGYVFISAGNPVGYINPTTGYWTTKIEGEGVLLHRAIWEMHNGALGASEEVDHEDQDQANNRIKNLRAVSHSVNCRNRSLRADSTTGVTGVNWDESSQRYKACWINPEGRPATKSFSLARYGVSAFEAARAYRAGIVEQLNRAGAGYTAHHGI